VVGAAGQNPGGRAGAQVGQHFPLHAGHEQLEQALGGNHGLYLVHYKAEVTAQIYDGRIQGRSGGGGLRQIDGLVDDAFGEPLGFGVRGVGGKFEDTFGVGAVEVGLAVGLAVELFNSLRGAVGNKN